MLEFKGGITDDLFIFSDRSQFCEASTEDLSAKVDTKEIEIQQLTNLLQSTKTLLEELTIRVRVLEHTA